MTLDRDTTLAGVPGELAAFAELLASLMPEELDRPTRCAGWRVADVAGHVVGVVVDVTEGRVEGQGTGEVNQRQAKERSGRSGAELAHELTDASRRLTPLLAALPQQAWDGPAPSDPAFTLGFAVEAIWFDAYVHGDDIRAALSAPSQRGDGLRCAVHHVAGYLEQRRYPLTLALEGIERIHVAGGGRLVTGDPLSFVLAATGRVDPAALGLDEAINVYRG